MILKQYKDLYESIKLYWKAYGGTGTFIRSPYLHVAIIISFISFPIWYSAEISSPWYNIALTVLPNLLGFTLGGYAIMLAFGDNKFREQITIKPKDDSSPTLFMEVNGTFVHFIILQAISIILAVVGTVWSCKTGFFAWFGFTFFIYTLLTAIAASLTVMEMSDLFQFIKNRDRKNDNRDGC